MIMTASIYGIKVLFTVSDEHFTAIKLNDNAEHIEGFIKYDKAFGIN